MNSQEVVLSIVVGTFNHEKFIEDCLNSILSQTVNFNYEIIISDAGSTDNTLKILRGYERRYRDRIRILTSDREISYIDNIIRILPHISGEFVAVIDGDDSYCNEEKLQTQVDFLMNNGDYIGCFHNVRIVQHFEGSWMQKKNHSSHNEGGLYSDYYSYRKDYTAKDAVKRIVIPLSSLVFRNVEHSFLLDFLNTTRPLSADWIIQLQLLRNESKLFYFPDVWALYNDHPNGITKKLGNKKIHLSNIHVLYNLLKDDYFIWLML